MGYRMPIYIQVQDSIIKKIEEHKYLPGEAILSERKMAELYGVNRMTVRRAVDKLVEQGYLTKEPGSGTYVAQRDRKKIELNYADETGNTGVTAMLKSVGVTVSNSVLGTGEVSDSRFLCQKLGLNHVEKVWGVHRVRWGGEIPFAVEYTYIPKKYFPDADNFDFAKVSLYDYMDTKKHLPCHFIQRLVACEANEKIADLLQVDRGEAVFKIEYQGADEDYNIVEYTKSYLNPKYAEFSFDVDVE